jgi:hypothetical protein
MIMNGTATQVKSQAHHLFTLRTLRTHKSAHISQQNGHYKVCKVGPGVPECARARGVCLFCRPHARADDDKPIGILAGTGLTLELDRTEITN